MNINCLTDRELVAAIVARNEANVAVRTYTPMIQARLQQFLGKKVQNQSGEMSKKFRDTVGPLPNTAHLQVFVRASGSNLLLEVKTSAMVPSGRLCVFQETYFILGELTGLTLTGIRTGPEAAEFPIDITLDQVKFAQNAVEVTRRAHTDAQNKLNALIQ